MSRLQRLRRHWFVAALSVSVLAHVALIGVVRLGSVNHARELFHEIDIVDSQSVDSPSPLDGEVVQTDDASDSSAPADSRFLAHRNQTVERQTAKRSKQASGENKQPSAPRQLSLRDLGLSQEQWLGDFSDSLQLRGEDGSSQDSRLPDVLEGNKTLLSAREYAHWSYILRMKQKIGPIWKEDIHAKVRALHLIGRTLPKKEYVVDLQALLTDSGAVQQIEVRNSSGWQLMDGAAIQAFEKASPFPNPPAALLGADKQLLVTWRFVLTEGRTQVVFNSEKKEPGSRARNL